MGLCLYRCFGVLVSGCVLCCHALLFVDFFFLCSPGAGEAVVTAVVLFLFVFLLQVSFVCFEPQLDNLPVFGWQ